MTNDKIVEILVERIKNGKINPVTKEPFKLEDIKIEEIKIAVAEQLNAVTFTESTDTQTA